MKTAFIFVLFLAMACLAALLFPHFPVVNGSEEGAPASAPAAVADPPAGAETPQPAAQPADSKGLELEGIIYANKTVHLGTVDRGQVAEINKKEGDEVAAGEVLARLKYDKAEIQRDQAATAIALAEARLQLAATDADYYERDFKKTDELYKNKAASESEVDQARLKRDESALNKVVAESDLAMAKETLRYREADVEETKITSPIKGVVTQKYIEVGEIYEAGSTPVPMFEIIDIDTVKVVVHLPQEFIPRVNVGDKVRVKVELSGEALYDGEGTVAYMHPTIDPSSETLLVKIDVPNPDHKIKVGLRGKVTFNWAEPPAASE